MGDSSMTRALVATAFACKGWCDRFGGIKSLRSLPNSNERTLYRYPDGARYCRRCEKYFVKELVERMDRGIYCPCCFTKTTGRARHSAKEFALVSQ